MAYTFKRNKLIISLQTAPFWVQSVSVIALINTLVFLVKASLFGLKLYYIIHIVFSISALLWIFLLTIPMYNDSISLKDIVQGMIDKQHYYFTIFGFRFASYKTARSRWTWLITFWSFLHMVYVSVLALVTWDCTMYVRITFAIAFFIFILGWISLKIQSRTTPLIFDNYREEVIRLKYEEIEPVYTPLTTREAIYQAVKTQYHSFHVLPTSFWPFLTAYLTFDVLFFVVRYFHYGLSCYTFHHLSVSSCYLLLVLFCWFYNIVQEANEGNHTQKVRFNLLHGFMLFIVSEIMLFFAIFWAFFHSSLAPTVSIYCMWPPIGIDPIYPWGLPFFNTVLLVSSGVTLTVSHRAILSKFFTLTSQALIVTLILGISFTAVQGFEYVQAPFSINDGVFGSVFFFSTGFHGLHVFIGSIMLSVSLLRNGLRQLLATQHIGFTAGIWYWHFVDVVWIFLFLMIYWWGS